MAHPTPGSTAARLVRAQAVIEAFRLLPDGRVLFVKRVVEGERYRSHLWLAPWRGGRARQLTRGAVRDTSPAISPDGGRVAFVRSPVGDDEAKAQVWVLPLESGAAWQLTSMRHGVGSAHWNPDGKQLALVAEAGEPRFVVGAERKGRAVTARQITRLDFRDDESGPVGRRSHLWLIAARAGARPRQLTRGDFDVTHPAWSPDGARIAFAADRGPTQRLPRGRRSGPSRPAAGAGSSPSWRACRAMLIIPPGRRTDVAWPSSAPTPRIPRTTCFIGPGSGRRAASCAA